MFCPRCTSCVLSSLYCRDRQPPPVLKGSTPLESLREEGEESAGEKNWKGPCIYFCFPDVDGHAELRLPAKQRERERERGGGMQADRQTDRVYVF